jgi:Predicted membrane protein
MSQTTITPLVCQICRKTKSPNSGIVAELVRPSLLEFIKKEMPGLDDKGFICFDDLGDFRKDYVKDVLQVEIGELSVLDQEVIESLEQHEILSSDISKQFEKKLTFGERLSDHIAEFGGSWKFLITFGAVLLVWIAINGVLLVTHAFDPYPFILLNLILSCLAAVQAPIIMMSQNRAEARDRLRAENDYKVNLKAELEIRHLHEKIDHLLRRQYNRLFEIQQIQIELLEELGRKRKS